MKSLYMDWTIENKGTLGLIHAERDIKEFIAHDYFKWLRGSVGKVHDTRIQDMLRVHF